MRRRPHEWEEDDKAQLTFSQKIGALPSEGSSDCFPNHQRRTKIKQSDVRNIVTSFEGHL
jgi:hypothetical protein